MSTPRCRCSTTTPGCVVTKDRVAHSIVRYRIDTYTYTYVRVGFGVAITLTKASACRLQSSSITLSVQTREASAGFGLEHGNVSRHHAPVPPVYTMCPCTTLRPAPLRLVPLRSGARTINRRCMHIHCPACMLNPPSPPRPPPPHPPGGRFLPCSAVVFRNTAQLSSCVLQGVQGSRPPRGGPTINSVRSTACQSAAATGNLDEN